MRIKLFLFAAFSIGLTACGSLQQVSAAPARGLSRYDQHQTPVRQDQQDRFQVDERTRVAALAGNFQDQEKGDDVDVDIAYPFLASDSLLTSAIHLCGGKMAGKKFDLALVKLTNHAGQAIRNLRVEASLDGYSDAAIETFSLGAGESKEIGLTPTFKNVGSITEMTPSAIHVKLQEADGKILHESTKRVSLLSRNDVLLVEKLVSLCCTLVTPNDKIVDGLITHAANRAPGRTMAGYQRDESNVAAEVRAIYETLADLEVHYRSNTTSFLNEGAQIKAQRVTFPAESICGMGANCMDGAILFASAFENVGLLSFIVLVPGHAFVGVKLQPKTDRILFVETTMVGTRSFDDAIRTGSQEYQKWNSQKKLLLIDVKNCRDLGIKPFPYSIGTMQFPSDRLANKPGPKPAPGPNPPPIVKSYTCPKCNAVFDGVPGSQVNCPSCKELLNLLADDKAPAPKPQEKLYNCFKCKKDFYGVPGTNATCPNCSTALFLPDEKKPEGKTYSCHNCGKDVVGMPGTDMTCPHCGTSVHLPDDRKPEEKKFSCHNCGKDVVGVPGTDMNCPNCGTSVHLPDGKEPPPAHLTAGEANELFTEGLKLLEGGDLDQSIGIFKRIYNDFADEPLGMSAAYNVACGYSRARNKPLALQWLEVACQKGFLKKNDSCHASGFEHAQADTDLDNIRNDRQFKNLLQKYR